MNAHPPRTKPIVANNIASLVTRCISASIDRSSFRSESSNRNLAFRRSPIPRCARASTQSISRTASETGRRSLASAQRQPIVRPIQVDFGHRQQRRRRSRSFLFRLLCRDEVLPPLRQCPVRSIGLIQIQLDLGKLKPRSSPETVRTRHPVLQSHCRQPSFEYSPHRCPSVRAICAVAALECLQRLMESLTFCFSRLAKCTDRILIA